MKTILMCIFILILVQGCGSSASRTSRVDIDEDVIQDTDISSKDLRAMSRKMAQDILQCPQIKKRIQRDLPPAQIAFVKITNETRDYDFSEWEVLTKIRGYLLQYSRGYITFLESEKLKETVAEYQGTSAGVDTESLFKLNPNLKKSDYLLTGRAFTKKRTNKDMVVQYHSYTFWLTHTATRTIVWQNDYQVQKASDMGSLYGRE